jgi:hypothetical protein
MKLNFAHIGASLSQYPTKKKRKKERKKQYLVPTYVRQGISNL